MGDGRQERNRALTSNLNSINELVRDSTVNGLHGILDSLGGRLAGDEGGGECSRSEAGVGSNAGCGSCEERHIDCLVCFGLVVAKVDLHNSIDCC